MYASAGKTKLTQQSHYSGRQGILGNEEADRLAKEGAVEVPPNHVTATF
jgi:hypothetical protein